MNIFLGDPEGLEHGDQTGLGQENAPTHPGHVFWQLCWGASLPTHSFCTTATTTTANDVGQTTAWQA